MSNVNNYECYTELAGAIIKRALKDFKTDEKYRSEVIRFIKSNWFKSLSNLDSNRLIKMLKEYECNERKKQANQK